MRIALRDDFRGQSADSKTFSGRAITQLIMEREDLMPRIYRVAFEPGGRTHWHQHDGVQILLVESGRGQVQTLGDSTKVIEAGDVVWIDPEEVHWHGAVADRGLTHLAVNLGRQTRWLGPELDESFSS